MEGFRGLDVWQRSFALAVAVYQASRTFPEAETFGLTSQLQRAAVPITPSIAEGYCRQTRADYLRFLSMAQGSRGEVEALLLLSRELGYLEGATAQELMDQVTIVGKQLTRLTRSLRATGAPAR